MLMWSRGERSTPPGYPEGEAERIVSEARGELSLSEAGLYASSIAVDVALRTATASTLSVAVLAATGLGQRREDAAELAFYEELARERDPAAVFAEPATIDVEVTPGHEIGLSGGRVEILRFRSPFQAVNPSVRPRYARNEGNAMARAQYWRHDDGPRPTLCVIHGFGASPARFNVAFFSLREFFAEGWDVLMFTMPFHGSRRGQPGPNGIGLFTGGTAQLTEAIFHAVHDFRAFLDYLSERGVPRVGVTGLSLGGYTAALLAAVEPRLDFAIPNAPVVWMPPLTDSWFPMNLANAAAAVLTGTDRGRVERALAVHSPLTWDPVLPKDRLMIVAGLGDRLAPPEQALWLWHHWGEPELHWFPGSHLMHFGRGSYFDAMRRMMGQAVPDSAFVMS